MTALGPAIGVLVRAAEDAVARLVEEEVGRAAARAAEVAEGRSWAGASRALFDHEVRAEVRFEDIAADHDLNAEEVEAVVLALHAAAVAAILAAISGGGAPRSAAAVSDALQGVRRAWPPALIAAAEEAAEALGDVFRRAADRGAATMAAEAARQGLTVTAPTGVLDVRQARKAAGQVADSVIDRLLTAGASAADTIRSGPGTAAAVMERLRGVMTDASVKQAVDDARQVTHHVYGWGREATVNGLPEPAGIYASELMDGNTCAECSHVDGKEYESRIEAYADYPDGGPHKDCRGGARCRGTLVYEWA